MPNPNNTREPLTERDQQQAMLEALDASPRALRRDECSCWVIHGSRGNVQTWGDSRTWSLYVQCRSVRHWTKTKKALAFCQSGQICEVTQDGDDEGVLHLRALPTREQAVVIRERLGLPKYRHLSPEELERLRTMAAPYRFRPQPAETELARPLEPSSAEITASAETGS